VILGDVLTFFSSFFDPNYLTGECLYSDYLVKTFGAFKGEIYLRYYGDLNTF
jgi:hypothetical protein